MLGRILFVLSVSLATSAYAGFDEGYSAYKSEDYATALKEWLPLAKKGDASAQHNLGVMYKKGQGVPKNLITAVSWYRKAATQGDASSQNALAVMYETGNGVKKNEAEAVIWYRKAAEQGYANAQTSLGVMYQYGKGIQKDEMESVNWYRKAADQGNAQAQTNLGAMYEVGAAVQKDEAEAVTWYSKAAEQGYARAQGYLGGMYRSGTGITKNYEKAAEWLRKGAEQGSAYAQANLGVMYEFGQFVRQDDIEAGSLYRKAADQGNEYAKKALIRLEDKRIRGEQELAAQKLREEEERKRVSQVGQQICNSSMNNTTLSKPTNIAVMGETVYQKYRGKTTLVGFVEGSSGNKIQIRISGMTFEGEKVAGAFSDRNMSQNIREPMDSFTGYNGSNLQNGSIIWDDYHDWSRCSYR